MSGSERELFQEIVVERSTAVGMRVKGPNFRPNSLPALQAAEVARSQGKFDEFRPRLFDAYWVENSNIGHLEVLQRVASSAGMDPRLLEQELAAAAYLPAIEAAVAEVGMIRRKVLPLFRWDGFVMYGLPREYNSLRRLIDMK